MLGTPKIVETLASPPPPPFLALTCLPSSSEHASAVAPHSQLFIFVIDVAALVCVGCVSSSEEDVARLDRFAGMANFDEVYGEPFERCLTRFRDQLTPTRLRDLKRDGRVVIDNFLGRGWALALLQEMRWLHGQGWVGFGLPKRGRRVGVLEGVERQSVRTSDLNRRILALSPSLLVSSLFTPSGSMGVRLFVSSSPTIGI